MKKLLFALLLLFYISSSYAQDQNQFTYCEIVGTQKLLSTKLTIAVDYGQERKWNTDTRIKDETGKTEVFNSMVDALNFMGEQGWEFVQAYIVTIGNQNVYHYLLKRKK